MFVKVIMAIKEFSCLDSKFQRRAADSLRIWYGHGHYYAVAGLGQIAKRRHRIVVVVSWGTPQAIKCL